MIILLYSSHYSWENEVLFVKIAASVLDLWLDMSSGPKWPKCSFYALNPMVKNFFEISWFCWIHPMFLEKIKFCLWKLELEFWTNGLISPLPKDLEPNCPKLGFRSQTPNVIALGSQSFFMSISIKFCIK